MTIVCAHCKEEITSKLVDDSESIKDCLSLLSVHIRYKHKQMHEEYTSDMQDITEAVKLVPSFVLFTYFLDLESPKTDNRILLAYQEIEEKIAPLAELFSEDEESGEDPVIKVIEDSIMGVSEKEIKDAQSLENESLEVVETK